jgi:hypothetical protein
MMMSDTPIEVPLADDASVGLELPTITDDYMRSRLGEAQHYTLVILRKTPKFKRPDSDPIV